MSQKRFGQKNLFAIATSFLMLCFFYRFIFFLQADLRYTSTLFNVYTSLSFGFAYDIVLSFFITLMSFIILSFLTRLHHLFSLPLIEQVLISSVLFLSALIFINHKVIVCLLHIPFDFDVFFKAIKDGFSPSYCMVYVTWKEVTLLILSIVIFPLLMRLTEKTLLYIFLSLFTLILLNIGISKSITTITSTRVSVLLSENPILLSTLEYIQKRQHVYLYENKKDTSKQDPHSIHLNDENFVEAKHYIAPIQPKPSSTHKWNVVIFVLESTGFEYIFSPLNDKIPMPFLKALAKKGWWLENHYTSGNGSALAEFSLFTSLYTSCRPNHFEQLSPLNIPSLNQWLNQSYDTFLVSPTSSQFYAAKGLRKHAFNEIIDSDVFAPRELPFNGGKAGDEKTGFKIFLERLRSSKAPFFGVYWSSAAHHPYIDYGSKFWISPNIHQDKNRYLNNLFLLDEEIKQLITFLKSTKLLEQTIVVIVGDHGESFGHHNAWIHGFSLNQQDIKTPALFYQPAIFSPKKITRLTSIVDIMPTLLDAMGVDYNPKNFQGQSLFRKEPSRKYIFLHGGEENEVGAINQQGRKLLINFTKDECRSYDLKKDPLENKPYPCAQDAQEQAIIMFRNYQSGLLSWYNQREYLWDQIDQKKKKKRWMSGKSLLQPP